MSARRVEHLDDGHELADFTCGTEALDAWLFSHALAAQQMDSARTFVVLEDADLVGYFSLTMGSVRRAEPPQKLARGLPGYPVEVVVLARLAVHVDRQGQGIGGVLLAEALRKALTAGAAAAARLVVVDAIDDAAAAFYSRYGFLAVPEHPERLYRRLKDIRSSLG